MDRFIARENIKHYRRESEPDNAIIECLDEFADDLRRVALRVDADEQWLEPRRIIAKKPECLTNLQQRGRTNIRAMRIAEIDKQPLAAKVAVRNALPVGAGQLE